MTDPRPPRDADDFSTAPIAAPEEDEPAPIDASEDEDLEPAEGDAP